MWSLLRGACWAQRVFHPWASDAMRPLRTLMPGVVVRLGIRSVWWYADVVADTAVRLAGRLSRVSGTATAAVEPDGTRTAIEAH